MTFQFENISTPSQRLFHAAAVERRKRLTTPVNAVPDTPIDLKARKGFSEQRMKELATEQAKTQKNAPDAISEAMRAYWLGVDSAWSMMPPQFMRRVIEAVGVVYGIAPQIIISHRRLNSTILPRHIAMYLAKELTLKSYPEIGRAFGGRDHTTIMHACKKIARIMANNANPELTGFIRKLEMQLRGEIQIWRAEHWTP